MPEDNAPEAEATPPTVEEAGAALESAADEAIAQAPTPKGFYTLEVAWRDGTTEVEREQAMGWVKESAESIAELSEDAIPLCVDAYTLRRDGR